MASTTLARVKDEIAAFLQITAEFDRCEDLRVENCDSTGFVLRQKNSTRHDFDLLICGLTHGDEVLGLEAINQILSRLLVAPEAMARLDIGFLLGNVEAAKQGLRFIESDLNRSFLIEHPLTMEHRRAHEMQNMVRRAKFVLDYHQTVEPTESPFFVIEHSRRLIRCARSLSADLPIVTFPSMGFSHSGKTLIELASSQGVPALVIEWGQKGFSHELATRAADFAFNTMARIETGSLHRLESPTLSQPPIDVYYLRDFIKNTPGSFLHPGLINYMEVKKGQEIGHDSHGAILASQDGRIFFPKYGALAAVSPELCELGVLASDETATD